MTKRAIRISQSKALSPVADEIAPLTRGDRHGEAFRTATSLDAGQDRENIPKTSAMPHESSPRVTFFGGDEGSLQHKLNELMDFCTKLQSQHTQMAKKIQIQDLEISQLKTRIKTLEDAQKTRGGNFTTAGPPVPPVSLFVPTDVAIASGSFYTTEVFTTASATPRVSRPSREVVIRSTSPIPINIPSVGKEYKRKGKAIMTEPENHDKAKALELMSDQLARELEA
ncbi:hypothetical protein Tco_1566740, partial [Tanacetum coccineum]